jgi:hypothetical protein
MGLLYVFIASSIFAIIGMITVSIYLHYHPIEDDDE